MKNFKKQQEKQEIQEPKRTKETENQELRSFTPAVLRLLIPIIIQELLSATVSSADVIMLNYVGQSSLSAVSLAAQYANVLFMVFYGLGTGASMLCAQYHGKGDVRAIETVEGIALRFSLVVSTIFMLLALFMPRSMMRIFTEDAELIEIGSQYICCIGVSYFCWGLIEVYLSVLRSIGKVTVSMVLNVVTFLLNILLNAVFIFGLLGAPKLGAMGVALATSLSRIVELVGCFIISARRENVKLKLSYMFIKNRLLLKDFIKMSLPALGNDVSWGVGFSMYSVILGHLGNDVVAANSIVTVVRTFGSTFCFAVGSAAGIMLGNTLGEGKLERAKLEAKKLLRLAVIAGLAGGVIVLAITPFVLNFADITDRARGYLRVMLLINSYYILGSAVNTTLIAGVFRAGGDSRFGFICDTIDMWVYAVPLGFLSAFVLKLPTLWVYFLICTDEFVKWPWVIARYKSGKWIKNITRDF